MFGRRSNVRQCTDETRTTDVKEKQVGALFACLIPGKRKPRAHES